jgi:hypothetical protein
MNDNRPIRCVYQNYEFEPGQLTDIWNNAVVRNCVIVGMVAIPMIPFRPGYTRLLVIWTYRERRKP